MLVVGELVGSVYRVVRFIGKGGMGEVYEALHEPLSRRVAIKTMRPELFGDSELVARFRREAESSAALGHPNIVQVTDFLMERGEQPIMVMELLEGRTLRELVTSAQKLETSRAVFIALQILSGLAAAHKAGIIHRDVKPANIFLTKTLAVRDHVKLLDFGVAKLAEGAHTNRANAKTNAHTQVPNTERGIVVGTRAYMAPEQEEGGSVDVRSDLYSVGATLYYALSGKKHRELNRDARSPVPLRRMTPNVSAKLATIVEQALAFEPDKRFPSAEAMAEALAAFSGNASGFGTATLLPGKGLEEAAAIRPRLDSSTETAPPKTVREDRFSGESISMMDSVGVVRTEPAATTDPLETTVDDPMSRKMMDGEPSDPAAGASTGAVEDDAAKLTKRMDPPNPLTRTQPTPSAAGLMELAPPTEGPAVVVSQRANPFAATDPVAAPLLAGQRMPQPEPEQPPLPVAPQQQQGQQDLARPPTPQDLARPPTPQDMQQSAYPSFSSQITMPPSTKRRPPPAQRTGLILLIILFIALLIVTLIGGRFLAQP